MIHSLALAALTLTPAHSSTAEPVMRVAVGDLDFTRPEDVVTFLTRLDTASRSFCTVHRSLVTPEHVGQPRFCEDEMRAAGVRALPRHAWRAVVTAERHISTRSAKT